jgi:tRNA threonylcarbamoyladenosine biosynthesis protein TsaB
VVKVLGFDCAGSSCSAAVVVAGEVISRRFAVMERGQAEALLPMIEAVLREADLPLAALDLIAVTLGPGGFTGLRVALATARGLALASGVPVAGVTCFEAVAAAVGPAALGARTLVVALESKRAELFLQCFGPSKSPLGEAALVAEDDWARFLPEGELLLAGDGAARLAARLAHRGHHLGPGAGLPDAVDVARLAACRWRSGERPPPPRPFYLHAPDTTLPARPA